MDKIKILQFTVAATKGGRTQYVLNVWRNINKERFAFDFITFSKSLDFEDEINKEGGKVFHISVHPEQDIQQFVEEFNAVLANKYDVIEIHTSYWVSTIVEELARQANIPKIIVHAHSTGIGINEAWDSSKRDYLKDLHYRVRNKLDESIATDYWACSKEAAAWLFSDRIPAGRIEIINNTIDTEAFKYDVYKRDEIRRDLMLANKTVIGFTGRLEKVKNIEFLIDVFYEIKKNHPNICLLIVGDGRLRGELEQRCESHGMIIGEDVLITGLVNNVSDYLQVMDVFALPSHFEGFSLSTLEAQCSGLRCYVSENVPKAAAVTDLVKHLPLEQRVWVDEIKKALLGYDRRSRADELKEKGFDSREYIKVLENKYAN